jgi:hypothetical protein
MKLIVSENQPQTKRVAATVNVESAGFSKGRASLDVGEIYRSPKSTIW